MCVCKREYVCESVCDQGAVVCLNALVVDWWQLSKKMNKIFKSMRKVAKKTAAKGEKLKNVGKATAPETTRLFVALSR